MIGIIACLSLLGWLYLALLNGWFWKPLVDDPAPGPDKWPGVAVVVPARNEADMVPRALASLLDQDYPGPWRVVLVDDHSTDGTGEAARALAESKGAGDRLMVVQAPDLPEGWSGKVAAMQAGVDAVRGAGCDANYFLFTDADIAHPADSLRRLTARALADRLDLVSLMVRLNCTFDAEKLLIPAFVFFFAMLYPFRKANDSASRIAAAAGGVMLVRAGALARIGGLARIKSALIDDCSLARAIKEEGGDSGPGRTSLTLATDVVSLRPYPEVMDVRRMIARTAFTQLRYSSVLLAGTLAGLGLMFLAPVAAPLAGGVAAIAGGCAWLLMAGLYLPMVRFYRLPWPWAFTLPLAALVYMRATFDSALDYWRGRGGQWKGRAQAA